jgi:predicted ATPase
VRQRLKSITLRGVKSIRSLNNFEPGRLSVLIGPNGAGKSNLISFFRLLSWSLAEPGNLQIHVAQSGGASALLHDGPDMTREIESSITLVTDAGENQYEFRIVYAAGDTFVYADERYRFSRVDRSSTASWNQLDAGHKEAKLITRAAEDDLTAWTILGLLRKMILYQFHNTSATARMRGKWDIRDNRWLKEDAGNLAPFLCRLKEKEPSCYQRIVDTIRLILPFFADFVFDPDYDRLLLQWKERGTDRVFSAFQAADGMLRVMALVSLLLQPEQDLPDVMIVDEPELGLHPYAISIVGGLLRSVSMQIQVIVATQSVSLIDCFEPEDIVVVDRKERESSFTRLSSKQLGEWLENYTLSELWEKNVVGGRP